MSNQIYESTEPLNPLELVRLRKSSDESARDLITAH